MVLVRQRFWTAHAGTAIPDYPQTSTRRNTTNMTGIDKAIEDLELFDQLDCYMHKEVFLKYGCSRSTVPRRWTDVFTE
jgi:hypothetical protein